MRSSRLGLVRRLRLALGLLALCALIPAGHGEVTLTTLYSFSGRDGANPVGELVWGSDGNFYGLTQYGGWVIPAEIPPATARCSASLMRVG